MKAAHNISLSLFLNSDWERAVFKARKTPMVIGSLVGLAVSLFASFYTFQYHSQLIYDEPQLSKFELWQS